MTTQVRAAALTHFAQVAADCGLDALALLREVGLPARCLDDPDLRVPAARVGRLLELAAERGHEPAFALRMVQSRRLSNLGPLALLVRDEPTLRSALEAMVRHVHLHNEALAVHVEPAGPLVLIQMVLTNAQGQPLHQATELALGVTFRVLALFLGAQWQPRLVCFTRPPPRQVGLYHQLFGPRLAFGHDFDGIACSAHDLDAPNPGADPVMARMAQRLLDPALAVPASLAQRVRQLLVMLLPRGHCRVEVVAQHLGVDRRTVARRLAAEGTSFSALVDELRADLAQRYRRDGARSLAEVGALLGFAHPSAFSRWHRQHFGVAARVLQAHSRPETL